MGKVSFQLLQSSNAQEEPILASNSELFPNFLGNLMSLLLW